MFDHFKKSLHLKILFLVIGIMTVGVIISIFWELESRERELLEEKLRASRLMAKPVLNAIYEDMLEERADMARHLLNTLGNVEGMGMRIIRSNGYEEAFKDLKTIEAVKKEFGEVKPEWLTDHPDEPENRSELTGSAEFRKAFKAFRENWKRGAIYYIDEREEGSFFTYLQPIEKKSKCNTCHVAEGARGILMIETSLDDMYAILAGNRNQWIAFGISAISIGGFLLSLLIKRSITGPIRKNVEVIKRIASCGGGKGSIRDRVEVTGEDEVGYLSNAFNNMLDNLEKREEENEKLFSMVAKSKEEWMATFDAIQDIISIHDREDRILKVNEALARKFNVRPEELIGRRCNELFYGRSSGWGKCPHATTIETGSVADAEVDDLAIEGTYKITTFPILNAKGEVWATVHIARDISDEKLLREQLLHAEKLTSVGKLVAGIAHELNNPLMGIMGYSQILMDTPGETTVEEVKEKLRMIYHESIRTAKIVQNLLTFARTKKSERELLDINHILTQTFELKEYSLKTNNIKVVRDFEEDLPKTMLDLHQIQQVFINIINNAEDAIVGHKGSGTLVVKTRHERSRIYVTIEDDGPGIPKNFIHKIFDPFFTTKEVGKGTGLGLSITHGIITEHGGNIEFSCPDGCGTLVTMDMPVLEEEQWVQVEKAIDSSGDRPEAVRDKRILIVDDEKSIRETLSGILTKEGFRVETARDGREAIDELGRRMFELVITDIKMPGIGGMDLYNTIANKHPYLKSRVIVVTGDIFSKDIKRFLGETKCPYFLKPFKPRELITLIDDVLAA
jgi:PAS domain S-box-containing protein